MKMNIRVLAGTEEVAHIRGIVDIDPATDMSQVIEIEQWLERMTGLRYHVIATEMEIRAAEFWEGQGESH